MTLTTRETETVVKSRAKIHVTTNDQSGGKKEDGKHLDKNRKNIKKLTNITSRSPSKSSSTKKSLQSQ